MHRREGVPKPKPKPKGKTPALVKMPKYKKVSKGEIPLLESHRLSFHPSVRMCCVCVRFHSVNSSISPTGGITKNKKGKLLPSPRKQVDTQF